jgi:hypothetical protein
LDGIRGQFGDRRKILIERDEGGQQRQQGFRRSGLDDQPFTLLAHDGVLAGQLELAGNAHCLVSPVLEKLDMSLWGHCALHSIYV